MTEPLLVIVVTGTVGSGKSTVSWALHDLLGRQRIPNALVDMDYLRSAWPQVTDWNNRLGYDNLAAVAISYRKIGVRCFVVADVVETEGQRVEYEAAIPGAHVVTVRLSVPLDIVATRLQHRESQDSLEWYLARAPELQAIQEARGIGDVIVNIDTQPPRDIALDIFTRLDLANRRRLD